MTTEQPEWTPDRPKSHWPVQTAWESIARQGRSCGFHGEYVSTQYKGVGRSKAWWSRCPRCDDVIHEEQMAAYEEAVNGYEMRKQMRAQRARVAGIPLKYADAEPFETMRQFLPKMAKVHAAVKQFCTDFDLMRQSGRSMVMMGPIGTGKTFAACAIANYVIGRGQSARYTTVQDMGSTVRSSFNGSGLTEAQVVLDFTSTDLLVLDEVGRSGSSDHTLRLLRGVLDGRYRMCRPSIVVTNLPKTALQQELGDAIWDRLREAGGRILVFDWESLRAREDI